VDNTNWSDWIWGSNNYSHIPNQKVEIRLSYYYAIMRFRLDMEKELIYRSEEQYGMDGE
jgi:hypothetical protein